jgi:hypothetical protein
MFSENFGCRARCALEAVEKAMEWMMDLKGKE